MEPAYTPDEVNYLNGVSAGLEASDIVIKDLGSDITRLFEANQLLTKVIDALPEWMVFGNWDTPRCLWCKGFQHKGGHKPNCLRQQAKGMG